VAFPGSFLFEEARDMGKFRHAAGWCLLLMLAALGCESRPRVTTGQSQPTPPTTAKQEKTAIVAQRTANLRGRVTYDGNPPKPQDIRKQILAAGGGAFCFMGPRGGEDRVWVVKDGNVANVAIWIRPPTDKYFTFTAEDKKSWPEEVTLDQPYCHFEPHVSVAFVKYFDGKDSVSTGQKIKMRNSAPVTHNTKWQGDPRTVPGGNRTIAADGEPFFLHNLSAPGPDPPPRLEPNWLVPVSLKCDIHTWMEGYLWVLETPYAAVTKEDGTYEIKGIPAGVGLQLVVWHEGLPEGKKFVLGSAGQPINLAEGDNTRDFKIKK
jgi:hypothetical protein